MIESYCWAASFSSLGGGIILGEISMAQTGDKSFLPGSPGLPDPHSSYLHPGLTSRAPFLTYASRNGKSPRLFVIGGITARATFFSPYTIRVGGVVLAIHNLQGDLEASRRIKDANPAIQIIMVTGADDDDQVFAAFAAGAGGYCLKNAWH